MCRLIPGADPEDGPFVTSGRYRWTCLLGDGQHDWPSRQRALGPHAGEGTSDPRKRAGRDSKLVGVGKPSSRGRPPMVSRGGDRDGCRRHSPVGRSSQLEAVGSPRCPRSRNRFGEHRTHFRSETQSVFTINVTGASAAICSSRAVTTCALSRNEPHETAPFYRPTTPSRPNPMRVHALLRHRTERIGRPTLPGTLRSVVFATLGLVVTATPAAASPEPAISPASAAKSRELFRKAAREYQTGKPTPPTRTTWPRGRFKRATTSPETWRTSRSSSLATATLPTMQRTPWRTFHPRRQLVSAGLSKMFSRKPRSRSRR